MFREFSLPKKINQVTLFTRLFCNISNSSLGSESKYTQVCYVISFSSDCRLRILSQYVCRIFVYFYIDFVPRIYLIDVNMVVNILTVLYIKCLNPRYAPAIKNRLSQVFFHIQEIVSRKGANSFSMFTFLQMFYLDYFSHFFPLLFRVLLKLLQLSGDFLVIYLYEVSSTLSRYF